MIRYALGAVALFLPAMVVTVFLRMAYTAALRAMLRWIDTHEDS